jgi:hypothetical protein
MRRRIRYGCEGARQVTSLQSVATSTGAPYDKLDCWLAGLVAFWGHLTRRWRHCIRNVVYTITQVPEIWKVGTAESLSI